MLGWPFDRLCNARSHVFCGGRQRSERESGPEKRGHCPLLYDTRPQYSYRPAPHFQHLTYRPSARPGLPCPAHAQPNQLTNSPAYRFLFFPSFPPPPPIQSGLLEQSLVVAVAVAVAVALLLGLSRYDSPTLALVYSNRAPSTRSPSQPRDHPPRARPSTTTPDHISATIEGYSGPHILPKSIHRPLRAF